MLHKFRYSLKFFSVFGLLFASINLFAANPGYLMRADESVSKGNYGQCWRTAEWTPAYAIAECDPDLVKRPTPVVSQIAPPRQPEPAPVPAPAVLPKPAFEKITLETEALFDFDKASLRPQGKEKLEDLVSKMNQYPEVDMILISGHADRLGSPNYNLRLSERRAAAVKGYLVERGVAGSRVDAVGRGEADPVTDGCKGNKKTQKLISCLQPDRRVEVEIKAQREKPAS